MSENCEGRWRQRWLTEAVMLIARFIWKSFQPGIFSKIDVQNDKNVCCLDNEKQFLIFLAKVKPISNFFKSCWKKTSFKVQNNKKPAKRYLFKKKNKTNETIFPKIHQLFSMLFFRTSPRVFCLVRNNGAKNVDRRPPKAFPVNCRFSKSTKSSKISCWCSRGMDFLYWSTISYLRHDSKTV